MVVDPSIFCFLGMKAHTPTEKYVYTQSCSLMSSFHPELAPFCRMKLSAGSSNSIVCCSSM
jgi:hypothetical protein